MINNDGYEVAQMESQVLSNYAKSRKLRYFGYVMRLSYVNTESSVMVGFVEGTRGLGRPRIS